MVMADPRSSKMIAERLRVGAMPPPSAHPDADLLTAFAERSLGDAERAHVVEHLARCAVCRDVVYFAQPEADAASPQPAGSRAQIRWFAWRRLQWAALAASLSVIVAVTVFLKNNPERSTSVLSGEVATKQASPQGGLQESEKSDANKASTSTYATSPASENERSDRREAALSSPESQQKVARSGVEAKLADGSGQSASVNGKADFKSRDFASFMKLTPGVAPSSADDAKKTAKPNDKEAGRFAWNNGEKDTFTDGTASGVRAGSDASTQNGGLFDLRQQPAKGGPYSNSNTNSQNIAQNNTTNSLYRDRDAQAYDARAYSVKQSPPSPVVGTTSETVSLDKAEMTQSARQSTPAAAQMAAAKPAAPATRGVVPAEEGRKKKLETIPAHATPQGTEETVAVAGRVHGADSIGGTTGSSGGAIGGPITAQSEQAATSSAVQNLPLQGRAPATLVQLTPGVAPTSAISGWRIHHGQVQERLYGIWHDVVVGTLRRPNAISAPAVPQPHFVGVVAAGNDIWAVQAIGKGQPYLVLYNSTDTGITWQPSTLTGEGVLNPNAQVDIKFKDTQQGEVILSSGEKWQTSDGGAHWNFVK